MLSSALSATPGRPGQRQGTPPGGGWGGALRRYNDGTFNTLHDVHHRVGEDEDEGEARGEAAQNVVGVLDDESDDHAAHAPEQDEEPHVHVEVVQQPASLRRAWWLKVENPQLWGGLRRAPEAMVSFQAAQAALWGA